jgi:hypothetical protein
MELDAAEMKMAIQIQADPGIMGFLEMCFDMRFSPDRDLTQRSSDLSPR